MPLVATVAGCTIRLYFDDHEPAHFHAIAHGGQEAVIRIADLSIMAGDLPAKDRRNVIGWGREHQDKLALAWLRCREGVHPGRID